MASALETPSGHNQPGDFDFLAGEWAISHRKRRADPDGGWDEFVGEATCWTILDGLGSVEELRIPGRGFAGLGLRLLDREAGVWKDFWVNAKNGVLTTPGQSGSFAGGIGTFVAEDLDGDRPYVVRCVWDHVTPTSCRWYQQLSYDGGASWQDDWYMAWERVDAVTP
jgi:hypothetical protein